ncbi:MAG: hypothetical protein R2712_02910 [Vicinamibacterales bacterium]
MRFSRELNATDDRSHFVDCRAGHAARAGLLPIVDGRHLSPFRLDLAAVGRGITRARARTLLDEAATFGRDRLCCRDVAGAANRTTLIAAVLPPGVVSTHTVWCARPALAAHDRWCLLGLLNSLPVNYLVRMQMTMHVSAALLARLPVPRPLAGTAPHAELGTLARRLASTPDDDAFARLNALVSSSYGLTAEEHAHVVSTFPLLPAALRARIVGAFG